MAGALNHFPDRPLGSLGARAGSSGVTRVVVARELQEQAVQLVPLVRVERVEEVVLDPAEERASPRERALALRRHRHDVTAAVVRIPSTLDEPLLLEVGERAAERAAGESERGGRLGPG